MPRTRAGPRMSEVAAALGVSVSTVSRVLGDQAGVSEELRHRVLETVQRLGYAVPARATAGGRLEQVAFALRAAAGPAALNPFYSPVLGGAETEARRRGLRLQYRSLSDDDASDDGLADLCRPGTGVLLVGHVNLPRDQLEAACSGPCVLVDNYIPGLRADSVLGDNRSGVAGAVRYLHGQGHRTIGFLGLFGRFTVEERYRGYRETLLDLGLPHDPDLTVKGPLNPEAGFRALNELLQRPLRTRPTAVCCASDLVALGALRAAAAAGLRVPGDIAVVGFDDIDLAAHVTPALTTVRVPKQEMGAFGVRRLVERAREPGLPPTRTVLEVELVRRESA